MSAWGGEIQEKKRRTVRKLETYKKKREREHLGRSGALRRRKVHTHTHTRTRTYTHTRTQGVVPSCSVFVISSSFFCFSVSTTSARLPLRRSGVPNADPLSRSLRSRAPSSGLCGEVELFRKEYREHTLLLSDSCKTNKSREGWQQGMGFVLKWWECFRVLSGLHWASWQFFIQMQWLLGVFAAQGRFGRIKRLLLWLSYRSLCVFNKS